MRDYHVTQLIGQDNLFHNEGLLLQLWLNKFGFDANPALNYQIYTLVVAQQSPWTH